MEENVALDSSKQKQFVKSIKKLIKKDNVKDGVKPKEGKIRKPKRAPRGLVYLGHIPHGFYENEMTQYFKQFGMVTNVRVIRSKRTGNSKGFAFVEFKEPAVAEIVAETMNNYLMGKRLIKAAYIPPEKQKRHAKRKFWSTKFNPGSEARIKMKKAYNANKDEQGELQRAKKLLSNLSKTKKKLRDLGIDYEFFVPVDVPESLQHLLAKPEIKQEEAVKGKEAVKEKLGKKIKKEIKVEGVNNQISDKKKDKKKQAIKVTEKPVDKNEPPQKVEPKITKNKKSKTEVKVNDKEQKQKEKKLKDAGVKPVENFIKIQESDNDSDSSYDFDSDEFEKMLGSESDDSENEASDESGDEEQDLEKTISEEEAPKKKKQTHKVIPATKVQKQGKQESSEEETPKKKKQTPIVVPATKVQKQGKQEKKSLETKRKASHQGPVPPKKSKFENRSTQKIVKKQFKKK